MHTRRAVCTALLLAPTASACSSGEPKTIRVTVTQTVTATPGPKAAPDASDSVLKMGDKKTVDEDCCVLRANG